MKKGLASHTYYNRSCEESSGSLIRESVHARSAMPLRRGSQVRKAIIISAAAAAASCEPADIDTKEHTAERAGRWR